jgi:cytochrome c556
MKHQRSFKTIMVATVIGTLLATVTTITWANDDAKAKPLALRRIMQDIGKNMQVITDGISREDWELVAKTAPLIADHPQPPLVEKIRILSFVGSDAGQFKGHDEKTHQAAQELRHVAKRQDGPAVVAAFATVQNNCLACHQKFRKPFMAHFYGKR